MSKKQRGNEDKMATYKYSRQREAIKSFLATRKDHPTADVVYMNMRKEFPNISLGTVYRNLSLLVELGEAIKVPCSDGSEHFDGCTLPHYHFQCRECEAVLDIDIPDSDVLVELNHAANEAFGGEIEGHEIFFFGKCQKCKEKNN